MTGRKVAELGRGRFYSIGLPLHPQEMESRMALANDHTDFIRTHEDADGGEVFINAREIEWIQIAKGGLKAAIRLRSGKSHEAPTPDAVKRLVAHLHLQRRPAS
jgi:hypothetical protein